ncbi:hypothetical protein COY62_02985 [bacterium (Candidatus Howlettbacteria) CG_4_10_14_0_8_um_filter_40_9]|nr:MAG: hypothetical protein COY62_02985 [bacterium (Candidatus Howlettbacteria) CG_4_10_14_0_8_um_filter_40_9]
MPARNVVKEYVKGGIYHVYNRGVNKYDIFESKKDYATFLYYLKLYLENPENLDKEDLRKKNFMVRTNFFERVELLGYCLMPNHFHLIIKQTGDKDLTEFVRCIATNYSMYFNSEHDRVGTLFQGRYKAILIKKDNYLLHLSRYIHLNPLTKGRTLSKLSEYEWSSYADYLGLKDTTWLKRKHILDYFSKHEEGDFGDYNLYKDFVEGYADDSGELLGNLTLE